MKKILLIVWVLALTSCSKDIVDLNDPQNFNEGNYYSNMNECLEAVAAIYSNLVDPGLDKYFFHAVDAMGQEMSLLTGTEPTQPQFNNYNVDANNPLNAWIWQSLFRQVWRASFALEKIEAWQPTLENENKQKKLKDELKEYIFFEGAGIADNQDWQPEKSLFVLNIDIKKADYLMEKYQQNAIVIGSKSKIPELKFNRLLCQ